MKVALYARTSTRDKGQNPEMQLEPLRHYCEVMGWVFSSFHFCQTKHPSHIPSWQNRDCFEYGHQPPL